MSHKLPPSKRGLILAVAPAIVAIAGMLGFGHFGISLGVILTVVGLVVYYVIFGIVYVVKTYKHDTAQQAIDKAASPALKAATIFLIIATVALIGGAFAAFGFEYSTIGWICVGAWVGIVLLFVVVMSFTTRVRKTPPKSANRRGEGVCELCVPAMSVSYMSAGGYKTKSTYKIIVDLDGRKLTAYSHEAYQTGDMLEIAYSDGSKKCYIINSETN